MAAPTVNKDWPIFGFFHCFYFLSKCVPWSLNILIERFDLSPQEVGRSDNIRTISIIV